MLRAEGKKTHVEGLHSGDLVMTADHGPQEIRWINKRSLCGAQLLDRMRPIRFLAHAMGSGMPTEDLLVSPQHRMLVRSKIVRKMIGVDEVLVAAKHLLGLDGVEIAEDVSDVTYVHFMCEQHEIVFANNAPSETLYTGPQALKSVPASARAEIMDFFPELADMDYRPSAARPLLQGRKARNMTLRHKKNDKPLLDGCACDVDPNFPRSVRPPCSVKFSANSAGVFHPKHEPGRSVLQSFSAGCGHGAGAGKASYSGVRRAIEH